VFFIIGHGTLHPQQMGRDEHAQDWALNPMGGFIKVI
jgi:hypothetical protein